MSTHPLRLFDRSRVTTDWQCPRKRYLAYEYEGKGIVSGHESLELFLGSCLHEGLASIARMHKLGPVAIDVIALDARETMLKHLMPLEGEVADMTFAWEQATLVEGLLRGYFKHSWPLLMQQYPTILLVEQEMHYDVGTGLRFMAKPDLVVADNDGSIWYVEHKSTSSKNEKWVDQWATAVQLHSSIKAIEKLLGEKVTGVIVQGHYKGYQSYNKQNSPFCYAYKRAGNPPFSYDEIQYEYKAGFKRFATWELEGGVKKWVENMPSNILMDQFPQTPPIFIKDQLIEDFFAQRSFREQEIKLALQMLEIADEESAKGIMDTAFPQKFSECNPGWGSPCMYRKICHGRVSDPLSEGFSHRVPHHEEEAKQWGL